MAVLVLTVLVGAAVGFVHGEPEASDDPERSRSAHEMLTRLWSAARERVDAIRKTRADQQGQGHPEPAMSNSDMFASALDYVRDKVKHPPLLSTERRLATASTLVGTPRHIFVVEHESEATRGGCTRTRSKMRSQP